MSRGAAPRPARRPRRLRFPGLLWLSLAALLGLAVMMAFAERLLLADLAQHARAHLAAAALLCLGVALLRRRHRQALAALGLAGLLGWPAVESALPPGWFGADAAPLAEDAEGAAGGGSGRLTLVAANVYIDNPQPEAALERLLAADPDVLVLIELDRSRRDLVQRLEARYPHSWRAGDVTVWSRFPAEDAQAARAREFTVDVALTVAGRRIRLLAIHAPRPPNAEILEERNWLLSRLGDWTRETKLPTLAAGDFNATPWTPAFARLLDAGPLVRARPAGGWYASWPAPLGDFGIPIDHLLYGQGAAVGALTAFEVPGADHRALGATILLP